MARFSIGEAYSEGFSLIARKPIPVLVWGLAYYLLRGLPLVLMVWLVGPDLLQAWGAVMSEAVAGGDPQTEINDLVSLTSRLQLIDLLNLVLTIFSAAVINAAVFRAVLRPEDGGLFHMKVGMDEVWQGLIYVCVVILLCILFVAVVLVAGALGAAVWFIGQAAGSPAAGWIQALGFIGLGVSSFAFVIWICLRFSLAGPATFANRSFQLFESWTLTKGQAWPLFGLALLLAITVLAIELVLGGLFLAAFFAAGSMNALSPEAIEAFFARPAEAWLADAAPWLIGVTLVGALVTGALYAIWMAPWASAYRQIAGAAPAAGEPESVPEV